MAQEVPVPKEVEEENEGEVDLEVELISALDQLKKTIRDLKKVKRVATEEQESQEKSLEETKRSIAYLKLNLEEAKRMCEVISTGLSEK